jgi:hypothetical protein
LGGLGPALQVTNGRVGALFQWRGEEREELLFEKKKQQPFAPAPCPTLNARAIGSPQGMSKSFLVLFFKKEHFFLKPLAHQQRSY